MVKKGLPAASRAVTTRQGEGFTIEVDRREMVSIDGRAGVSYGIDLGSAPAPDRRYVADTYDLRHSAEGFLFLFGQRRISRAHPNSLRSLLVIHLSSEAVGKFLESIHEMTGPSLAEMAAGAGSSIEAPEEVSEEPDGSTVALSANLAACAVANREACIDFYQTSPFSIAAARRGGKMQMSSVVRVETRTGQLAGLVRELDEMRAKGELV